MSFQTVPITTLPPENLSFIFSLVIQQASPITAHTEFVRLLYVCRLFHNVMSESHMWKLLFAVSFDLRGYEASNPGGVLQTNWKAICQNRFRLLKKIKTTVVPEQIDDKASARYYMWMKRLWRWTIENDGHIALQFAHHNVKRIIAGILQSLVTKLRDLPNHLSTLADQDLKFFHQGTKVLSMSMSWSTINTDILDQFLIGSPLSDQFRLFVYANTLPSHISPAIAHGIHAYAVMCLVRLGYELPSPIRGGSEMFLRKKSQAAENAEKSQSKFRPETEREEEENEKGKEDIDKESGIKSGSNDDDGDYDTDDSNNNDDSSSSSSVGILRLPNYPISPYRTYTGEWAGCYFYRPFFFVTDEFESEDILDKITYVNLIFRPAEGIREESSERPPMQFHGSGTDDGGTYLIENGNWDAEGGVSFVKQYMVGYRWDYRGIMIQAGITGIWGNNLGSGGFWLWKVEEETEL